MLVSRDVIVTWWFGFLGSPYEMDNFLGLHLESGEPPGPKPPIYHSVTYLLFHPKHCYSTSMATMERGKWVPRGSNLEKSLNSVSRK